MVVIRDLEAFVAQSDEELNATLLGPELVERLRTARRSPLQRTKKRAGIGQPFMWDVVGLERVLESDLNQAGHTHLNTAGTINNVGLVEQVFARDKG